MSAHPGGVLTGQALLLTLLGGCAGTFAYGSGLLVVLATTYFRQNASFFARTLEATQSYVEWFVLFNFNVGHPGRTFTCLPVTTRFGKYREHAGFKGCGC